MNQDHHLVEEIQDVTTKIELPKTTLDQDLAKAGIEIQNSNSESAQDITSLFPRESTSPQLYTECKKIIENGLNILHHFAEISYSRESFDNFQKAWSAIFYQLESSTKNLALAHRNELRGLFRSEMLPFIAQSKIAMRAFTKPFGYPGDFQMLQFLYDNIPASEPNIGKYLDQFFLDDPLAKAVYNRAEKMTQEILQFINETPKKSVRVLNIASGPGFDLLPIAATNHNKEVSIDCFDQDLVSLMYVNNKISPLNKNTNFRFIQEDIKYFFKRQDRTEKYDLIYNIGLADYLPDQILKALIRESLAALSPGSEFIIAHKNYKLFPKEHPDWMYNWVFIPRTEEDALKLVQDIGFDGEFSIFYADPSKVVYFLRFKV